MGVIVHLSTIYNEKYIQVQIHKYKYKHLNTNTAQKEGIKSRIGVIIHLQWKTLSKYNANTGPNDTNSACHDKFPQHNILHITTLNALRNFSMKLGTDDTTEKFSLFFTIHGMNLKVINSNTHGQIKSHLFSKSRRKFA